MNALEHTRQIIEQGIASGLHPGAQLCVSLRGRVVADAAFGESRGGVAMTADTVNLLLSAGKPFTAVAAAQLWERGLLSLDDPIARFVPAFAAHGKERITIRHALTHTGGFRLPLMMWSDKPFDAAVSEVCDARPEPDWEPGKKAGYHIATSWYMLGEVVRRVSGLAPERYLRERVFEPLGMTDTWVGMPPEVFTGYAERMGLMYGTEKSIPVVREFVNSPAASITCRPGGGARGTARDLVRFYESLLPSEAGHGSGNRLLKPDTIEQLTARQRVGLFDQTFRHVIDWGLGFLVNSYHHGGHAPYQYGRHAGPRAFGHSGSQSTIAFADPDLGLAAAIVLNGMPGEPAHQARQRALCEALYEDLKSL